MVSYRRACRGVINFFIDIRSSYIYDFFDLVVVIIDNTRFNLGSRGVVSRGQTLYSRRGLIAFSSESDNAPARIKGLATPRATRD